MCFIHLFVASSCHDGGDEAIIGWVELASLIILQNCLLVHQRMIAEYGNIGFYPRTLAISSANLANLAPDINSPLNHWELMTLCPYFSLLSFELTIYYYDTFLFFTYPLMF